ncbi:hypothetical protein [Amycolatopsis solani]|uniref:hypothetical protein n=1 Tax=Amycolatopsis solani TaxID=3028615 RepID=UPI0025B22708|nr:hypothetical protein [Amycolatopsis sp. MEP2-6]
MAATLPGGVGGRDRVSPRPTVVTGSQRLAVVAWPVARPAVFWPRLAVVVSRRHAVVARLAASRPLLVLVLAWVARAVARLAVVSLWLAVVA